LDCANAVCDGKGDDGLLGTIPPWELFPPLKDASEGADNGEALLADSRNGFQSMAKAESKDDADVNFGQVMRDEGGGVILGKENFSVNNVDATSFMFLKGEH